MRPICKCIAEEIIPWSQNGQRFFGIGIITLSLKNWGELDGENTRLPRSACWELSMEIFWAWRGAVVRAEWGHVARVTWWHGALVTLRHGALVTLRHVARVTWWHVSRVTWWHVSRADWRQISARVITQRQAEATWENNEDKSLKLTRVDSLILGDDLLVTVCCYRVVHPCCCWQLLCWRWITHWCCHWSVYTRGPGVSCSWIYWGNDISSVRPQLLSSSPLGVRTLDTQVMIVM